MACVVPITIISGVLQKGYAMAFKINGQTVTRAEWDSLRLLFETMGSADKSHFQDKAVTKEELFRLLDVNKDGWVRPSDFKNVSARLFSSASSLLEKYGFNLSRNLGNMCSDPKEIPDFLLANREFILAAVKLNGLVLEFAGSNLKADREIVLAAVSNHGAAIRHADALLKADKEIALIAVCQYGTSIRDLDAILRADRDIVEAAVKNTYIALQFSHPKFLSDREIVLAAVKQQGGIIKSVDSELKSDREIALVAIEENESAFKYIDEKLRIDRNFILDAVGINGLVLQYVDPIFKKDREIVSAAVSQNWKSLIFASQDILTDQEKSDAIILLDSKHKLDWVRRPDHIYDVVADYIQATVLIDDDAINGYIWGRIRVDLGLPAIVNSYNSFRKYLKETYDIEYCNRIHSVKEWKDVLSSRAGNMSSSDERPVCIVVYPKSDWNGSFSSGVSTMHMLTLEGYRIVYYEAKDERQVRLALTHATMDGRHKASLIVLGGHGRQTNLNLWMDYSQKQRDEKHSLDIDDFNGRPDIQFDDYLNPNGSILLESCSTGKGGAYARNLANAIANTVSSGISVLAPEKDGFVSHIFQDESGLSVKGSYGDFLYKAHGTKR